LNAKVLLASLTKRATEEEMKACVFFFWGYFLYLVYPLEATKKTLSLLQHLELQIKWREQVLNIIEGEIVEPRRGVGTVSPNVMLRILGSLLHLNCLKVILQTLIFLISLLRKRKMKLHL
jgi:hypothetical protein